MAWRLRENQLQLSTEKIQGTHPLSTDKTKFKRSTEIDDNTDSRTKRVVAEGGLFGWIILCVILLLALISYSSSDPGWSHTGSRTDVSNLAGPAGAWVADVFYALFGAMAYLFPVLLALRAVQILRTYYLREADSFDSVTFILRVIGFVLVMISATSLASIQYGELATDYPIGIGGILGSKIGEATLAVFSYTGSTIILLALFLFGLTVFADISWIRIIDQLGRFTLGSISRRSRKSAHRQSRNSRQKYQRPHTPDYRRAKSQAYYQPQNRTGKAADLIYRQRARWHLTAD